MPCCPVSFAMVSWCGGRDLADRGTSLSRWRAATPSSSVCALAAATEDLLDRRTALVLSMTGPARLLEVVAPERRDRRHARDRIDHALDRTDLEPVGDVVRRLLAEAAAAAAIATAALVATSSG